MWKTNGKGHPGIGSEITWMTSKDVENINITTDKITKRFESINNVEIKNQDYLE